jgi:hypothetical protein
MAIYERRVSTFSKLMDEVESLDADAGIRLEGRYAGKRCYVFVTRSPAGYAVMVYRRDGRFIESDRLFAGEFESARTLGEFLKGMTCRPFRAYVY